jgi:hypothetical protein
MYGEEDLPTSTPNLKAVSILPTQNLRKCLEEYAVKQTEILQPENYPTWLPENEYQQLPWRGKITVYDPEDVGIIILRNIAVYLQDYTVSQSSKTIVITWYAVIFQ